MPLFRMLLCVLCGLAVAQDTLPSLERDRAYLRSIGVDADLDALRAYLSPKQSREAYEHMIDARIAALGANSAEVRDRAFAELLALGPVVFSIVDAAPRSRSAEVRARLRVLRRDIARRGSGKPAAVRLLAELQGPAARDFLFGLLSASSDPVLHRAVGLALEDLGLPAPEECAAALPGMPASGQAAVLRAWRRLGLAARRQLDACLEADSPEVRLEAGCLYVSLGLQKGLGALIGLLQDDSTARRLVAEEWLKRYTANELRCFPYGDAKQRADAAARWEAWLEADGKLVVGAPPHPLLPDGQSVICDFSGGRVLIVDTATRRLVWERDGIRGACHVRWLHSGRLLVAAAWERRALEIDIDLGEVWSYEPVLRDPVDMVGCVERMPNGNTMVLVSSQKLSSVLEVSPEGEELRRLDIADEVDDCDLLPDGNLLITGETSRTVSVRDWHGNVVWSASTRDPREADMLPSGHVLVADGTARRVVELDAAGEVVWEFADGLIEPHEADRLRNGNTTICDSEGNRIVEVTRAGEVVWSYQSALNHPDDIDRAVDVD